MLSSLIVLGAMLGPASRMATQNPQFPKPDLNTPSALQESSIFKYLSTEDKKSNGNHWKSGEIGQTSRFR
jgi:hypothetical protein